MDDALFDALTRRRQQAIQRRTLVGRAAALALLGVGGAADEGAARRRRRCRHGKKRCGKKCVKGTCCPGKSCGTNCACARTVEGKAVCHSTIPVIIDPCAGSGECDAFERCFDLGAGATSCLSLCA